MQLRRTCGATQVPAQRRGDVWEPPLAAPLWPRIAPRSGSRGLPPRQDQRCGEEEDRRDEEEQRRKRHINRKHAIRLPRASEQASKRGERCEGTTPDLGWFLHHLIKRGGAARLEDTKDAEEDINSLFWLVEVRDKRNRHPFL